MLYIIPTNGVGVGFMRYIEGQSRYQKTLFPDVMDDFRAPLETYERTNPIQKMI
jgi:hypothetical protein